MMLFPAYLSGSGLSFPLSLFLFFYADIKSRI